MRSVALRYLGACGCAVVLSGCGARSGIEAGELPAAQVGAVPACSDGAREEVCNGIDDDCDGEIDEDLPFEVIDGPIAVRTDEGRTDHGTDGDCTSCGWAWDPQLVMPGGELGVVWYLGIYGSHEQPSGFFRRLSWELEPQGVVSSLGPGFWMSTLGRGATRQGAPVLTFVERKNSRDWPSFALLGSGFRPSASVALEGCSVEDAGRGLLTVLLPGLVGCGIFGQLHTFVLDDDGRGVSSHIQHQLGLPGETNTDSGGRSVAALNGDSGLVALPLVDGAFDAPDQLWTQRISAQGAPLAEALRQPLDGPKSLRLEGLFSAPNGYLLFGEDSGSGEWPHGRFVLPLGLDGRVNGELVHFDQGLADRDAVSVLRVGSGFVLAESTAHGLRVEQLDQSGAILSDWQQDVPIYSAASLLFAHGHLYLAFAEPPPRDGGENRVVVSRFSCKFLR